MVAVRNKNGRIRQDRSEFGEDVAVGWRNNTTLGRLREETGKTAVHAVVAALPKKK